MPPSPRRRLISNRAVPVNSAVAGRPTIDPYRRHFIIGRRAADRLFEDAAVRRTGRLAGAATGHAERRRVDAALTDAAGRTAVAGAAVGTDPAAGMAGPPAGGARPLFAEQAPFCRH